jgi:hypothetical protein
MYQESSIMQLSEPYNQTIPPKTNDKEFSQYYEEDNNLKFKIEEHN